MSHQEPKKKDNNQDTPFNNRTTIHPIFRERPFHTILDSIDQFFQHAVQKPSFHVDLREEDRQYIISAELPGVDKKGIDIRMMHNSITITAERNSTQTIKDDKQQSFQATHSIEKMSRTIPLYHPIQEQNIKANYRDGLLTIILPKKTGKKIHLD